MLLKMLLSLLTGGIGKAMDSYRDVQIARLKEQSDANNVIRDMELASLEHDKAAAQNAREIRLATKDHWEVRLAVALVAIPTSFHYAATVADAIYHFGWAITPLPAPLNEWQGVIILGYFGYGTLRNVTKAAVTAVLRR